MSRPAVRPPAPSAAPRPPTGAGPLPPYALRSASVGGSRAALSAG